AGLPHDDRVGRLERDEEYREHLTTPSTSSGRTRGPQVSSIATPKVADRVPGAAVSKSNALAVGTEPAYGRPTMRRTCDLARRLPEQAAEPGASARAREVRR